METVQRSLWKTNPGEDGLAHPEVLLTWGKHLSTVQDLCLIPARGVATGFLCTSLSQRVMKGTASICVLERPGNTTQSKRRPTYT